MACEPFVVKMGLFDGKWREARRAENCRSMVFTIVGTLVNMMKCLVRGEAVKKR